MRKLLLTPDDRLVTLLRVALGTVMFAHGAQKLLGWFGGFGPEATIGYFAQAFGLPAGVAALVIAAEFLGGLGLVFGALSRVAAAGVIAVMAGAIAMVHAPVGFFMNWTGQQAGEGFEFHVLVIAIATVVLVRGAGALSLDRVLAARLAPAVPAEPALIRPEPAGASR